MGDDSTPLAGTQDIAISPAAGGQHVTSPHKAYTIHLPDWWGSASTSDAFGGVDANGQKTVAETYLRLGGLPHGTAAEPGDDLFELIKSGATFEGAFIDDDRVRDDASPTPDDRKAVTAQLRTHSGWRDHADGNRVTTTRGDKIEVIRGNYKLLVLGRQDDAGNGAWWEASGGLIQDNDIAPGAISSISYEKNPFSGTWKVVEEFAKADVVTRYHGNVREEFYGEVMESIVGGAVASAAVPFEDEGNQSTHMKCTRPVVKETTYAKSITSKTNVDGTIEERTEAKAIDEQTKAGTISEMTSAGTASSLTNVALSTNLSFVGTENEVHIGAQRGAVAVLLSDTNVTVAVKLIELIVGTVSEYNVGSRQTMNLVNGKFELDSTETTISTMRTDLTNTMNALTETKNSLSTTQASLSTQISGLKTDISALKTEIGACVKAPAVQPPRPPRPVITPAELRML